MIPTTLFLLTQSIMIPSITDNICNYNTSESCIDELGCGWCSDNTCKYVGVCHLNRGNNNITNSECEVKLNQSACEIARMFIFFIVLGTTISIMSCGFTIINRLLNFSVSGTFQSVFYVILLLLVLGFSMLPALSFYYLDSLDFIIVLTSAISLSVIFWICYGGETVRKSFINRSHAEYQRLEQGEIN